MSRSFHGIFVPVRPYAFSQALFRAARFLSYFIRYEMLRSSGRIRQIRPGSQDLLHPDLIRRHAELFVKSHRTGVAAPHVERDMVAAVRARKVENVLIDRAAHMPAAGGGIDADVVDVQCEDVGHERGIGRLFKNTEAVAEDPAGIVRADEDRGLVVRENGFELLGGIFGDALEKVGAPVVVHLIDLLQKLHDRGDIALFGAAYGVGHGD